MSKNLAPTLNVEAILSKSKIYIRRAIDRKTDSDLDEYQLWASLALELLGKAALSNVHPCLIADPMHYQSLFAAAGQNISTDIKTISAHTLYERLRYLSPSFDEKAKNFCSAISQRRNAELHSGDTPFKTMKPEAWEAHYWHCAYVILNAMGLSLDDWLGATQARAPNEILQQTKEAKIKAVGIRVERHRESFQSKRKADRDRALHEAGSKKSYQYTKLFTLLSDAEWETACPACGGKAFSAGIEVNETVIDTDYDQDTAWETVEKDFSGEQFHCPVCDLWLDGVDELEAAGIDTDHSESDQREMQYEPEYGND